MRRGDYVVEVVGRIEWNDKTGYSCRAKARHHDRSTPWVHAADVGDSLAQAREKAYTKAITMASVAWTKEQAKKNRKKK